jgi:MFS family permease
MREACGHPAAADPAELYFGSRELGVFRSDADVAGHRRFEPAVFGSLSDRYGRRAAMIAGTAFTTIYALLSVFFVPRAIEADSKG